MVRRKPPTRADFERALLAAGHPCCSESTRADSLSAALEARGQLLVVPTRGFGAAGRHEELAGTIVQHASIPARVAEETIGGGRMLVITPTSGTKLRFDLDDAEEAPMLDLLIPLLAAQQESHVFAELEVTADAIVVAIVPRGAYDALTRAKLWPKRIAVV